MKNAKVMLLALIAFTMQINAENWGKLVYQIEDAQEANRIHETMGGSGWSGKSGWPLKTERVDNYPSASGVVFKEMERQKIHVDPDTTLVKLKVNKLLLSSSNLIGELSDVSLTELDTFDISNNRKITGIKNCNFPKLVMLDARFCSPGLSTFEKLEASNLRYLNLSYNNLTTIESIDLPALKVLWLESNALTKFPELKTPALEKLYIQYNKITSLPQTLELPALKVFNAYYNELTGSIPTWDMPALEDLNLSSNKLSGDLPSFSKMPSLKILNLYMNELSGNLPNFSSPSIEYIHIGFNKLTGEMPNYSYTNLKELYLSDNKLSGTIPDLSLPSLQHISLGYNQFTGEIPMINAPSLESLSLNGNKLTGNIKNINFPLLKSLSLSNNELTGEIPTFNCPSLEYLSLKANKLTGTIPDLNYSNLLSLELFLNQLEGPFPVITSKLIYKISIDNNKLSGKIPILDFPELSTLEIMFNKFEGKLPIENLPKLRYLSFQGNNIEDLPDVTGTSTSLHNFSGWLNKLHFDDIIPYVNFPDLGPIYAPQQDVDLIVEEEDKNYKLSVKVGGSGNQYIWVKGKDTLANQLSDNILIAKTEKVEEYICIIKNPLAPQLTLKSKYTAPIVPNCWENDYFAICLEGSDWEGDEDNKIKGEGKITINDFLVFEGTLTLDTAQLGFKAEGKFYIADVPLPGGGIGNFKLAEGEYELALGGEDGKITGFLNDKLSEYVPEIGGLKLKLDNLELVGGRNAKGVKLSVTVNINNITPGCGSSKPVKAEIKFDGIEITSDGIDVEGMSAEDLAFAPSFCLKKLEASYKKDEDELSFGLTVLLPFIEVGGGFKTVKGKLDSVGMKAVLEDHIIPIGTTGIGIIGCEGKIASISSPPFNVKFGGIFSSVLNRNLFELTLSVEYLPPAELKFEAGDGKFFNPPLYDDWWMAEGGIYGSIDFKGQKLKTGGNLKIGPYKDKDDEKQFMANGEVFLGYKHIPVSTAVGSFKGDITIPEINTSWPFDWVLRKFGLPHKVAGDGRIVYKETAKFMTGEIDFGGRVGIVVYTINLNKMYYEDGFFYFNVKEADLQKEMVYKGNDIVLSEAKSFVIPENTNLAVISVEGIGSMPISEITLPDGTIIKPNNLNADIEYDEASNENKLFWTLYTPKSGKWSITNQNSTDMVTVNIFNRKTDFNVDAQLETSSLKVSWNIENMTENDIVEIYIDDNSDGYDGSYVGEAKANEGVFNLDYSNLPNECSFNVYATVIKDEMMMGDYADNNLANPNITVATPTITSAVYNDFTGKIKVSWVPLYDENIAGYFIKISDNDKEKTLGMAYPEESYFESDLAEFTSGSINVIAYTNDNLFSCETSPKELTVDVNEIKIISNNLITAYPNPFSNSFTLAVKSDKNQTAQVMISDLLGRVIYSNSNWMLAEGNNSTQIELIDVPQSNFILSVKTEKGTSYVLISNVK